MKVGAGKSEICLPDDYLPAEGFSRLCHPLQVRTAILSGNMELVILSVEMTSLPPEEIDRLKEILNEVTGVPKTQCFICVTHTFSAPHIMPDAALKTARERQQREELRTALEQAVRESARTAAGNLTEIRLQTGDGTCTVNSNRDIETAAGWWVATRGDGPADRSVHTVWAENKNRDPVLIFYHYAVQPSVLDGSLLSDGGKAVSGDLAGVASRQLEQNHPGATAIFLIGAAGDQAPVRKARTLCQDSGGEWEEQDLGEEGLRLCEALGTELAEAVAVAMADSLPVDDTNMLLEQVGFLVPAKEMKAGLRELKPTRKTPYIPAGERKTEVEVLQIGPIALVCVKPELNYVTAGQIMKGSPFERTLVLTMVNGGAKYMADEDSYDRITYQAMNSPFGKGAAEILQKETISLLEKIYERS